MASYKTFKVGRWSFDWYGAGDELRAYIARPSRSERWTGDYSVGRASTMAQARKKASAWAKAHPAQPKKAGSVLFG